MRANAATHIVWLVALSASLAAQDGGGLSPADLSTIHETGEAYASTVLARDWHGTAAFYLDEAVFYPPGEPARRGRDAIEACLAGFPALTDFTVKNTRVEGNQDVAYVTGRYRLRVEAPGGSTPSRRTWNFVQVLRKQADDSWGIDVHMIHPN